MAARKTVSPQPLSPGRKPPEIDRNYFYFDVTVKASKIHRWGIYAAENVPAKKKVVEYTGERISRRETRRRADEQPDLIYLFTLDNYWTLDGGVGGSGAQYINHCCDPNLFTDVRQGHIYYVSRRAITKGEELTVDYRFAKNVDKVHCKCGAALCRGTINLR